MSHSEHPHERHGSDAGRVDPAAGHPRPGAPMLTDAERRTRAQDSFWSMAGSLWRWKRFITISTLLAGTAAVFISLSLPNTYKASSRLLLPESGGGLSSALLSNLPSAATALLGGGSGGDYIRYLAILDSRSMKEAMVDTFNLVQVYDIEDGPTAKQDAIDMLSDYMSFDLDLEFNFLAVGVEDEDPLRSAEMSNFAVRRLNALNIQLATKSAADYRAFMEARYYEAEADMDSVLTATRHFQERYGVYDLTAQTEAFFEQIAQLRAKAMEAEITYDVFREQYGEDNARTESALDVVRAAQRKVDAAMNGSEALLPISRGDAPAVLQEWAHLEMERRIQVAILEVLRPLYEQARIEEKKQVKAVQVLDRAEPPVYKAGPPRSLICIVTTLTVFLLVCLFALVFEWWRAHHAEYARRLQSASFPEKPRA